MKRYEYENGQIILGTDGEIRSLYKELKQRGYIPVCTETPKFRSYAIYGIDLMDNGQYIVINSDTIARLVLRGVICGDGVTTSKRDKSYY